MLYQLSYSRVTGAKIAVRKEPTTTDRHAA